MANRLILGFSFSICLLCSLALSSFSSTVAKPAFTVRCVVESLSPEPTWEETDTRVRTKMEFTRKNNLSAGEAYRWYYNCRIEGTYKGHKRVFYSSTESNEWKCWFASSNSIDEYSHEFRQRFALSKLPKGIKNLAYRIEVVAFKGSVVSGEAVGKKRIQQMRYWKNFAGYNSQVIALKRPVRK